MNKYKCKYNLHQEKLFFPELKKHNDNQAPNCKWYSVFCKSCGKTRQGFNPLSPPGWRKQVWLHLQVAYYSS